MQDTALALTLRLTAQHPRSRVDVTLASSPHVRREHSLLRPPRDLPGVTRRTEAPLLTRSQQSLEGGGSWPEGPLASSPSGSLLADVGDGHPHPSLPTGRAAGPSALGAGVTRPPAGSPLPLSPASPAGRERPPLRAALSPALEAQLRRTWGGREPPGSQGTDSATPVPGPACARRPTRLHLRAPWTLTTADHGWHGAARPRADTRGLRAASGPV